MQSAGRPFQCIVVFTLLLVGCSESNRPYPNRPIKIVVPFAAGGGSDTFARVLKRAIEENDLLPEPLVIVNVAGAGGTIGSRRVLAADPDGYTVLLLHDAILISKHAGKVFYGPEAFQAVAGTAENGTVVAVRNHPQAYESLHAALKDAANRPNEVTFGCNLGTPTHLVGLLLEKEQSGAEFRFVQSGGGAHRFAALQGDHIDLTVFSTDEYLQFRSEGLKALAFLGEHRHPAMPELPTAREQGFGITAGVTQYWWMPKGTPNDRVELFADVLEEAMQTESVREHLSHSQADPIFVRDEQLTARLARLEKTVSTVNLREEVEMPNLPLFAGIGVLGLTLVVGIQSLRRDRDAISIHVPRQYQLAFACMGLVFSYATALSVEVGGVTVGFRLATFIFVIAFGWITSQRNWMTVPWLVGLAAVLSFGLHSLFTQVFQVDLP